LSWALADLSMIGAVGLSNVVSGKNDRYKLRIAVPFRYSAITFVPLFRYRHFQIFERSQPALRQVQHMHQFPRIQS
jgi:hypothetical protein